MYIIRLVAILHRFDCIALHCIAIRSTLTLIRIDGLLSIPFVSYYTSFYTLYVILHFVGFGSEWKPNPALTNQKDVKMCYYFDPIKKAITTPFATG